MSHLFTYHDFLDIEKQIGNYFGFENHSKRERIEQYLFEFSRQKSISKSKEFWSFLVTLKTHHFWHEN